MKKSTHNHYETLERQQYKKKYLQRRLEEEDADRQIQEYEPEPVSDTPTVVEERTM
jgi:hypothetical protein